MGAPPACGEGILASLFRDRRCKLPVAFGTSDGMPSRRTTIFRALSGCGDLRGSDAARTPGRRSRPKIAPLTGQLLIAAPTIGDPRFAHTVILMVRHDREGAFGIVINRPVGEESDRELARWGRRGRLGHFGECEGPCRRAGAAGARLCRPQHRISARRDPRCRWHAWR